MSSRSGSAKYRVEAKRFAGCGRGTGSGLASELRPPARGKLALYGEINFVTSPLRDVSSSVGAATHDFASLYVTPGIRLKYRPTARISPYVLVGGGYADYEQSVKRIDDQPNQASRELARGVFDFGAGVDVHVWRFVALRGEARDLYSGSPNYNIASISGGQHNIFITGAFVLRWH